MMPTAVNIANPRQLSAAGVVPDNSFEPEQMKNDPASAHGSNRAVGLQSGRWWTYAAVTILIAVSGVILWGGYTQGWDWTGVSDKDTLWHWMQILMVPIAFAALPGVLRDHQALRSSRKIMMVSVVVLFVGFVIVSYVVPWDWTGYTGNTLWDWLSLLLLPIAIISVRFLRAERTLTWAHYVSAAVLVAGFAVLVFLGYVAPWDWTGFTGNTFLDWVQLLILPILFPTVVVPAAAAWLTAKRENEEKLSTR